MKDLNFSDLFCEIFSGILAILVTYIILDCFGYLSLKDTLNNLKVDFSILTAVIMLGYLVGLIVDSIGLAFGEKFLDKFIAKEEEPTNEEKQNYFNYVSETIALYRNRQWKYYSLYRNIFILISIGLPFYVYFSWTSINWKFSIATTGIIIFIQYTVFYSMRTLIDLYYRITKNIKRP